MKTKDGSGFPFPQQIVGGVAFLEIAPYALQPIVSLVAHAPAGCVGWPLRCTAAPCSAPREGAGPAPLAPLALPAPG